MTLPPLCLTLGLRHWRLSSSPGRHSTCTLPHFEKRLNGLSLDHNTSLSTTVCLFDIAYFRRACALTSLINGFFLATRPFMSPSFRHLVIFDTYRRVPSAIRSHLCWGAVLNPSRSLACTNARSHSSQQPGGCSIFLLSFLFRLSNLFHQVFL